MIHFIVATTSEARPLIDFFKLKKKKSISNFIFFDNDEISLTISGIGKINAAMSVTHTYYEFNKVRNNVWVNLGIAGHISYDIGKIFLINKVIDKETNYKYFPRIINNCNLDQKSCITYSEQNFFYNDDLSDMEASGFFMAADKYTTKELIHSIKIISDNEEQKIDFSDKNKLYDIIKSNKILITSYVENIYKIWKKFYFNKKKIDEKVKKALENKNLSFYQKKEFTKVLEFYFLSSEKNSSKTLDFSDNLAEKIKLIKRKFKI